MKSDEGFVLKETTAQEDAREEDLNALILAIMKVDRLKAERKNVVGTMSELIRDAEAQVRTLARRLNGEDDQVPIRFPR
jgi:hypothetical protein